MEHAVKPAEQHKPGGETTEAFKKWNPAFGKPQTSAPTAVPQGNTTTNKPNQGWKSTKRKSVRQNETKRRELPHFVRTEMEILKHLRRVNRDLRILLQPKRNSASTPHGYKGYQPSRQCREQPTGKAAQCRASPVCKKSQNVLAKSVNMKSKGPTQTAKAPTSANRVAPLQANKSCTRKTLAGVPAVTQISSTATRRSTLKRLMLYFRPKRKLDSCQSVSKPVIKDNKKNEATAAVQGKTQNTFCCKLKRSLQATRGGGEKVKARHPKATAPLVKDDEALKLELKQAQVLKPKVKGRERILQQKLRAEKPLKPKVTEEAASKLKIKATDPLKLKEQAAEPTNANAKIERTVREKMLGLKINCFGVDTKSLQTEDDTKSALVANKKRFFTKTINAFTPDADCVPQEQKAVRQIESTISNGRFGNCLHFFKALRKPTAESTPSETPLKKPPKKRKFRHAPENIEHLPSSSHVNLKYMEAIKAIRRHNRDIYKDPHQTPSTSSLEEYFHVLSERMAREQKEADERKPRHRGRRGVSNYNLQRRRTRPPIK